MCVSWSRCRHRKNLHSTLDALSIRISHHMGIFLATVFWTAHWWSRPTKITVRISTAAKRFHSRPSRHHRRLVPKTLDLARPILYYSVFIKHGLSIMFFSNDPLFTSLPEKKGNNNDHQIVLNPYFTATKKGGGLRSGRHNYTIQKFSQILSF